MNEKSLSFTFHGVLRVVTAQVDATPYCIYARERGAMHFIVLSLVLRVIVNFAIRYRSLLFSSLLQPYVLVTGTRRRPAVRGGEQHKITTERVRGDNGRATDTRRKSTG